MKVIVHLVVYEIASKLHSGKIDPHGEDLEVQLLECFKPHILHEEKETEKNFTPNAAPSHAENNPKATT